VVAALLDPVIVSAAVNAPLGTVKVRVVAVGLVMIDAVVPLLLPVMVSPTLKLPDAPTVAVIVPTGYAAIAEDVESWARVCVTCSTFHR
jgi:hypothetical protein